MKPIREEFTASKEWQDIEAQAYPPEKGLSKFTPHLILNSQTYCMLGPIKVKKVKKEIDPARKTAALAAKKNVVAQPDGHVEGKDAKEVTVGSSTEETLEKLKIASGS